MKRHDYSDLATIGLAILLGVALLVLSLVAQPAKAEIHMQMPESVDASWPTNVVVASIVALTSGDPVVSLHYSSPGGEVDAALTTLDVMDQGRAAGLTYRCYVEGLAASAAFIILAGCDERFATRDSRFLHHEMWFPLNPSMLYPKIQDGLMEEMKRASELQDGINAYLAGRMHIRWEQLKPLYEIEYLMSAYELVALAPGFISIGTK